MNWYLCVVSEVQVSALWMESTSTTSINVGLIERLQQPHKVGTFSLQKDKNRIMSNIILHLFQSL